MELGSRSCATGKKSIAPMRSTQPHTLKRSYWLRRDSFGRRGPDPGAPGPSWGRHFRRIESDLDPSWRELKRHGSAATKFGLDAEASVASLHHTRAKHEAHPGAAISADTFGSRQTG